MTLEEVLSYLELSSHNPKFVRDYDYVVHQLDLLHRNNILSREEYVKIHSSFIAKKASSSNILITNVFRWYDDLVKNGYYGVNFTDDQLKTLIVAREVCVRFYSWVDMKRHTPGNKYILHYLNSLASNTIEAWKGGEEKKWDLYNELKGSLVRALTRGLVVRSSVSTVAKVVSFLLDEELKVIKSLPKRELEKMTLFSSSYDEELMDLDSIVVEVTKAFLSDLDKFSELSRKYHNQLMDLYRDGKLTKEKYTTYNAHLSSATHGLPSTKTVTAAVPIEEYYYRIKGNPEVSSAIVYNQEQILNAARLAKDFCKIINNDFLIEELVLSKLNMDLREYNYDSEVIQQTKEELKINLDMLQKYSIISVQQYGEYMDMGREKFG